MTFLRYCRDRWPLIALFTAVSVFVGVLLSVLQTSVYAIIIILALYLLSLVVWILIDFSVRRRFYREALATLKQLDKKYLLSEMLESPSFFEGQALYEFLKLCNKSMNDEIARYAIASKDYREFIELWIHEVKTPLASSRLLIENHPSPLTESLGEELDTIDHYLEQVLFFARSTAVEQDYIIREVSLQKMAFAVMRKNAKRFIREHIANGMSGLNHTVNTDEKWLEYILDQIVGNAVKYRREDVKPSIAIVGKKLENCVTLSVKDNGIGIPAQDLPKIFDKGFTGDNGRAYAKSTGLGLYLSKKLCDKMGLTIQAESTVGSGTTMTIVFPLQDDRNMTKV